MQKADYAPIEKIDFSAPKWKLTKLSTKVVQDSVKLRIPEPTEDELTALYKNAGNPVILSIIPPHSEKFVPQSCSDQLPKLLTSLYDKTLLKVSYPELLTKCEDVFTNLSITAEEAKVLEKATQSQSACTLWFNHRAGRITGRITNCILFETCSPYKSI